MRELEVQTQTHTEDSCWPREDGDRLETQPLANDRRDHRETARQQEGARMGSSTGNVVLQPPGWENEFLLFKPCSHCSTALRN